MKIKFSRIADLMLWGTIPLIGLLALWEHHLMLSNTLHVLLQMGLLVLIYRWAWFWYCKGNDLRFIERPENQDDLKLNSESVLIRAIQNDKSVKPL